MENLKKIEEEKKLEMKKNCTFKPQLKYNLIKEKKEKQEASTNLRNKKS
jgi:hypothetical protein